MAVATFDTLKFANALKAAGVPEKQAEAEATLLSEVLQVNLNELATKDDLVTVKADLKREIDHAQREIKESELRLTARINTLGSDYDLREWQLGMCQLEWMFSIMWVLIVLIIILMP